MIIEERAPAKINLGLRILGKRPDGYHDILSVFQTVDLCDTLRVTDEGASGLVCDDGDVPVDASNLICRAEDVFLQRTGLSRRGRFVLEKRIPMGAGLGGGSSDAAAALRALDRFHDTRMETCELQSLGAAIGSDVPFLITGGTAIVSGRGEKIEPVAWPFDFTYVIVFPGFSISTAWAYGALEGFGDAAGYRAMTSGLVGCTIPRDAFLAALSNDFETAVFRTYPVLGGIKEELLEQGAAAAVMSGSGSSVIAVFDHADDARRCAEGMKERYPVVHTVRALPPNTVRKQAARPL